MSAYQNFDRGLLAVALTALIAGCSADESATPASSFAEPEPRASFSKRLDRPGKEARSAGRPARLFENRPDDADKPAFAEPLIDHADGRVIGAAPTSAEIGVRQAPSGDVTLNVVDAEIRDVVRLVLEDALGVNYTIDPSVTGSVTVRTSRPIPADQVIATLGSILSLNGVGLVDAGGLYKILPIEQAMTAGGRPVSRVSARGRNMGSGVQVAPLAYADALQLADILQPFVSNGGHVQVDTTRNTLLLTGSQDQIATMTDLISMLDVDWLGGMSFGLYPLTSVSASQLAEELDQILGDPSVGALAGGLRLVPLDRLKALIVIAAEPSGLDRVASWIERLDRRGDGEGEQVYVYEVQNGRAVELASVLGELFDIQSSSIGPDPLLAPGLEPVSLSSLRPDAPLQPLGEDVPQGAEGDAQRFGGTGLGGGNAPSGRSAVGARSLTRGAEGSETRIVADDANNALLIRATAKEYKKILAALEELDRRPLQVLLEATIAEVTLRDELSYGVQWFFGSDDSSVTLSEFADGTVGQLFPGFSGLLSRGDVRVVLNALDSVSDVNVVSSPQILVLDNQTAQLEVGDEVPIVTQQAESIDTSDARIVNTVEQRQTGVILNVTPRVNASGLVVLDIQQEVSDVVRTTTSGIDSPTIAQRRIGTSVAVSSDQTVVLGGLIQDDVEEINSGVPLLKDIPLLGALFSATTQSTSRTELLVLITPKVLADQYQAVAATDELRRRLWSLEPLHAKVRDPIAGNPALETEDPSEKYSPDQSDRGRQTPLSSTSQKPPERPGVFMALLGRAPTEVDAWNIWLSVETTHAGELEGNEPSVLLANQDGSESYDLLAGPFNKAADAEEFCTSLNNNGLNCVPVERYVDVPHRLISER